MFISYNFLNSFSSGDTHRVQISAREPCQSFPGHWLLLTTTGGFAQLCLLSVFVFIKALRLTLPSPHLHPVQSLAPQATSEVPVGGCGIVDTTLEAQIGRFSGHLHTLQGPNYPLCP